MVDLAASRYPVGQAVDRIQTRDRTPLGGYLCGENKPVIDPQARTCPSEAWTKSE